MMFKPVLSLLSPRGEGARLTVLIFHRVVAQPDALFPGEMHAARFLQVCGWVKGMFNVLPLDSAVAQLKAGTLPARAACMTFDDGYADNFHVALPILRQCGLTATFFIATGFLDGGRMWNDTLIETVRGFKREALNLSAVGLGCHATGTPAEKRTAINTLIEQLKYRPAAHRDALSDHVARMARVRLPDDLMMTSKEVKTLYRAGQQIGAHTVSHPILAGLGTDQARQEIEGSKHCLEQMLGERVSLFAYPNGKPDQDYTKASADLVRRAGFDAAFSTQRGSTGQGDDVYQIRRFTPWDSSRWRFGARLAGNLYDK
jgi:peptidoglycan/xylan/chitin deacetylase (PgdA/CDA1 family)